MTSPTRELVRPVAKFIRPRIIAATDLMMRLRRRVVLAALLAACVRGGFWSKREDPLPDGGARCGSGNVVEAEFVDDDFCDCLDNGADEPHTAACAGATDRAAAPRFACSICARTCSPS